MTRGNGKPGVTDVTRELLGFDSTPLSTGDPNPFWDVTTQGQAKAAYLATALGRAEPILHGARLLAGFPLLAKHLQEVA
ncbi:MAG: hypothetical protein OEQ39_12420 [Gammaproteobacteria bacterium]|nr:hypothetical protein [Gammaproteobacteria bacterium]